MGISVAFLITGCLIQGVLCDYIMTLPQKVEALNGSCVFIPCAFGIDESLNSLLTDSAKRFWKRDINVLAVVFNSSSPNTGILKGEMFGNATQRICSTRFDNVNQTDKGKYYFRLEADGKLKYNYKQWTEISVVATPPEPTVSVSTDQLVEGNSVTLSCSIKIFCSFRPPFLSWRSSPAHLLNQNITQQQYQNNSHLISELKFNITLRHNGVNFTCTATHQLQQNVSTHSSRQITVQYAPKNTSVSVSPVEVIEGHSVTLTCRSDANPTANFIWIREADLNPVKTGPKLTINNTNSTHSGRYYCRAENTHGTQNASVLLDVQYAPKNTSVSVSPAEVIEGRSVTLTCRSDANPTANFTWIRDTGGRLNTVETGPKLTINNINLTHSKGYYCRAENTHGTQNASVLLDIQHAPKNTSVSVSPAEVIEGHSVTLTCSSDANPTANFTWITEADLNPVETGPNLTINNTNTTANLTWITEADLNPVETGPNLTIKNTNSSHSGRYYCRAENTHGTQNASVLLDVKYPPKNTRARVSGLAVEGRSVTLICSSDANPTANFTWIREADLNPVETGPNRTINNTNPTVNFTWIREADLNPVETGPNRTINNTNPTVNFTWIREADLNAVETGPNLTIKNTNLTHNGQYYCRAQNQYGIENNSVLLDVQYPPKNTSVSVSPAEVIEGDSVTLTCRSDANPTANFTWIRQTDLNAVETGPSLTINNTNLTHYGQYYCRAENTHGTQNASVLLDVQFAPRISSSCNRSAEIECVCEARGNPLPDLQWRLSGTTLTNSTEMTIANTASERPRVKSVIRINRSLFQEDVFQCFSKNIHGSAIIEFQPCTFISATATAHESRVSGASLVLLGIFVGVLIMVTVWIVSVFFKRRKSRKPSQCQQNDTVGLIMTQKAAPDSSSDMVFSNEASLTAPAPLLYSSIDFSSEEPPSGQIHGLSSLTEEYASIRLSHREHTLTHNDHAHKDKRNDDTHKDTLNDDTQQIYENMGAIKFKDSS